MEIEKIISVEYMDRGDQLTLSIDLKNIDKIEGHAAQGEGDKWYYDVFFTDGDVLRLFNVMFAVWRREQKKLEPPPCFGEADHDET